MAVDPWRVAVPVGELPSDVIEDRRQESDMVIGEHGYGLLGDLGWPYLGHGRPLDLALVAQSVEELLQRAVARRGGRWGGSLKFRNNERRYVLAADAQDGCRYPLVEFRRRHG